MRNGRFLAVVKLRQIFISPEHNYFGHHGQPAGEAEVSSVPAAEVVEGKGIVGDRFFGWKDGYKGQVTFFSIEVYEAVRNKLGVHDRPPSVFRRNLLVEGADLNSLIGKEFELQGIKFRGTQESAPCHWMEQAFAPGAEEAMKGNGGLRAVVLTSGTLRCEPVNEEDEAR